MKISSFAGKPAEPWMLASIPGLVAAYYTGIPDAENPEERVVFGTSGHRGTSLKNTFNELHILAICQAICLFRAEQKTNGPLFMGMDTHALSVPAFSTAMEVLAANGVQVMISQDDEFTPTPAVSHAILRYNKWRTSGFADGIIITPSHNPPGDGGFKYNPPSGGPAPYETTTWIENKANEILRAKLKGIKRIPLAKALHASSTHQYDYLNTYVNDLNNIIDMAAVAHSGLKIGVDALSGSGMHYWEPIAERYGLNVTVFNKTPDPTFAFMPVDWDGQIRMDPSSEYAMQNLIGLKDKFDISVACDTDYDRHGIVTSKAGLIPPNHYLAVMIDYLFRHRPQWPATSMVGKTVVSSQMIDRVSARLGRKVYEVPVGFKWYADGLLDGSLGFCGEESAGASFARMNGEVWTTDKDGMIAALLSAEIMAVTKQDPGELYEELSSTLGTSFYNRIEAVATTAQKQLLGKTSADQFKQKQLAGENITSIITNAPGNGASIGGLKVSTQNGWFAARPSGTEEIYKIYAESFESETHLKQILAEAQRMVDAVLK
ncbi:phosphoglucomutase (alpha-D-glucose-1,6-bisphosphate-dependent) [Dyadobacter psychrotolerans]|uniref:Alpha-D-glucose phosphate-specific phosphoglucomutase n=1 Tax=Dyadobacter psychrotolerans TaxID=2541721 RepID=A0A4R5E1V9_9BACT|nr:phosphoglucomutase (alpha-D-glucose-1,6-bisphosphate-dependent) [Dyadobacter psychrotolerans]TDE18115.1 alpha-D-glucose phosphate-specific phosphoglucomutase [Dyadobacter psychrotolerans]